MKKRVFSGIQPSGEIHIGNYFGAIKQWIEIQEKYNCIYGIVDYHSMTVKYNIDELKNKVIDAAVTYLSAGLDPERSHLMVQSQVPEHTELTWILNTVTPMSWCERVPTFKQKRIQNEKNVNMGLFNYPVLMTADIIIYKAEFVPVGKDQLPHIELAREITRKFNSTFGEIFPEPKPIITDGALIIGLDGKQKMSKSIGNCIYMADSNDVIRKKLATAVTDTRRVKKTDPGVPSDCNIFSLHKILSKKDEIESCREGCLKGSIGCFDCKKILANNLIDELEPFKEKKSYWDNNIEKVKEILNEGGKQARSIAKDTIEQVREEVGLWKF